jgi:hypothetical protein
MGKRTASLRVQLISELLTRARALLDQPVAEGPTDDKLMDIARARLISFIRWMRSAGFASPYMDWNRWCQQRCLPTPAPSLLSGGHQCLALNRSDKSQMPFSGIACQPLKRIAKYESSRGKKTDRTKGFCPKTLFGYY